MIRQQTFASLAAIAIAAGGLAFAAPAQAQYYGNNGYSNNGYYGNNNGYYGNEYGQQRLRCNSNDGRQNICRPNVQANDIRMVRKFSKAQCIEGHSYGLTRDGMVWVDRGCRADFVVSANGRYGNNRPNGNAWGWNRNNNAYNQGNYGYGQTFRCESHDGRQNYCNVDTRSGVQMIRQLSNARCIQGRTWGVERQGVWVANGCRAEFAIGRR